MKYAVYLPNFGAQHSARSLADLAREAEGAGWDGFFLWDHVINEADGVPLVDVWVALTAIAMNTSRLRLGATVTPLPRRHPWTLARQTASLDHLSGGRLTLGVGLGVPLEFTTFGQESDPHTRRDQLNEGLEILTGLWTGEPFEHHGAAYQVEKSTFKPACMQQPRIPVWVAGFWPRLTPFRRAALWDGVIPLKQSDDGLLEPEDVAEIKAFISEERHSAAPFDFAIISWVDPHHPRAAAKKVAAFAQAGSTWWLEGLYMEHDSIEGMRRRIRFGPPKFE